MFPSDGHIISDRTLHDIHVLDRLIPEPEAIYVMDRGYLNFTRPRELHLTGASFVTRAKSNLKGASRVLDVNQSQNRHHLRRDRFNDPDTGKALVFLPSQMTLPAVTICVRDKNR